MKTILIAAMLVSVPALAEQEKSTWDKTKEGINTTAEKIDSGTRKVIRKAKDKYREEKQEREEERREKELKEHEHEHDHDHDHDPKGAMSSEPRKKKV